MVEAPPTSAFLRAFLDLLGGPAIKSFLSSLGVSGEEVSWHSYRPNGVLNNEAILARSAEDEEVPAASALLNISDSTVRYQHFKDPEQAELVIRIEPLLATPLPLAQIFAVLLGVLQLPDAVGAFLAKDVGIATYPDRAVQVGVCLEGKRYLTDLINPGDVVSPPGASRSRQYLIYLLGEPSGKTKSMAVIDALRGLCDYGLHVHGYEDQLNVLAG
jgi:hypothetical protein